MMLVFKNAPDYNNDNFEGEGEASRVKTDDRKVCYCWYFSAVDGLSKQYCDPKKQCDLNKLEMYWTCCDHGDGTIVGNMQMLRYCSNVDGVEHQDDFITFWYR